EQRSRVPCRERARPGLGPRWLEGALGHRPSGFGLFRQRATRKLRAVDGERIEDAGEIALLELVLRPLEPRELLREALLPPCAGALGEASRSPCGRLRRGARRLRGRARHGGIVRALHIEPAPRSRIARRTRIPLGITPRPRFDPRSLARRTRIPLGITPRPRFDPRSLARRTRGEPVSRRGLGRSRRHAAPPRYVHATRGAFAALPGGAIHRLDAHPLGLLVRELDTTDPQPEPRRSQHRRGGDRDRPSPAPRRGPDRTHRRERSELLQPRGDPLDRFRRRPPRLALALAPGPPRRLHASSSACIARTNASNACRARRSRVAIVLGFSSRQRAASAGDKPSTSHSSNTKRLRGSRPSRNAASNAAASRCWVTRSGAAKRPESSARPRRTAASFRSARWRPRSVLRLTPRAIPKSHVVMRHCPSQPAKRRCTTTKTSWVASSTASSGTPNARNARHTNAT